MKTLFALFIALCAVGYVATTTAADGPAGDAAVLLLQKHLGKGLSCNGCHQENPPATPVKTDKCLSCHGPYDKLAEKTDGKGAVNPHGSHQGDLSCDSCHNVHKPSVSYCSQCHDFELRVP
jgi:fumarate reductase flavoprotein subunit